MAKTTQVKKPNKWKSLSGEEKLKFIRETLMKQRGVKNLMRELATK